ncbi:MAG: hypothetical protein HFG20_06115 [Anaerotruncus sp.]|nr:hypothetical protein [Anaerotruncus sp.]
MKAPFDEMQQYHRNRIFARGFKLMLLLLLLDFIAVQFGTSPIPYPDNTLFIAASCCGYVTIGRIATGSFVPAEPSTTGNRRSLLRPMLVLVLTMLSVQLLNTFSGGSLTQGSSSVLAKISCGLLALEGITYALCTMWEYRQQQKE